MADFCVLIPAYNPDIHLVSLVDDLIHRGVTEIIIVNDGSSSESADIFKLLEKNDYCHIINHAVNLGKGRALKTGFNYFYFNFKNKLGLVTADADGQHHPDDIISVGEMIHNGRLVLGTRNFDNNVPLRSFIGNLITRYVFLAFVGKKIKDTQSGLRGIPTSLIPKYLPLPGERYEYELNMLVETKKFDINIYEHAIRTIYIDNNRSSHFNPLFDSLMIYFVFIRFSFSSLFASFTDFFLFSLIFLSTKNILLSIVTGRIVIGGFIFLINKHLVFRNSTKTGIYASLVKYALLLLILGSSSYMGIYFLHYYAGVNALIAKLITETILFVASFSLQRDFIFAKATEVA